MVGLSLLALYRVFRIRMFLLRVASNCGSPARTVVKETKPKVDLMPIVLVSPSILEPEEDDRMEEEDGGEEYDDESRKQRTIFTKAASVTSRSTLSSLTESGSTSIVSARSLFSAGSVRSQSTVGKSTTTSSVTSCLNVNTPSTPKSTFSFVLFQGPNVYSQLPTYQVRRIKYFSQNVFGTQFLRKLQMFLISCNIGFISVCENLL